VPTASDASSYDAVLYPARPFVQTHPDRLATMATLFGLDAPDTEQRRSWTRRSPSARGRC